MKLKSDYRIYLFIFFSLLLIIWIYTRPVATVGEQLISRDDLQKELEFQLKALGHQFTAEEVLLELINSLKEVEILKSKFPEQFDILSKIDSFDQSCDTQQLELTKKIFGKEAFRRLIVLPWYAAKFLQDNYSIDEDMSESARKAAYECIVQQKCWVEDLHLNYYIQSPKRYFSSIISDNWVPEIAAKEALVATGARLDKFCEFNDSVVSVQVDFVTAASKLKIMEVAKDPLEDTKSWSVLRRVKSDIRSTLGTRYEIIEFSKGTYSHWLEKESQRIPSSISSMMLKYVETVSN